MRFTGPADSRMVPQAGSTAESVLHCCDGADQVQRSGGAQEAHRFAVCSEQEQGTGQARDQSGAEPCAQHFCRGTVAIRRQHHVLVGSLLPDLVAKVACGMGDFRRCWKPSGPQARPSRVPAGLCCRQIALACTKPPPVVIIRSGITAIIEELPAGTNALIAAWRRCGRQSPTLPPRRTTAVQADAPGGGAQTGGRVEHVRPDGDPGAGRCWCPPSRRRPW
jgi:hypothetical protein